MHTGIPAQRQDRRFRDQRQKFELYSDVSVDLPVRIQALAVASGAIAVAALGHSPVAIAVRCVAVLAESGVVVEPGGMDLAEVQGRAECLGDPAGPAGVDGVAVAVLSGDAFEQQVPLSGLTLPLDAVLHGAGPLSPVGGQVSGGDELDAC